MKSSAVVEVAEKRERLNCGSPFKETP